MTDALNIFFGIGSSRGPSRIRRKTLRRVYNNEEMQRTAWRLARRRKARWQANEDLEGVQ